MTALRRLRIMRIALGAWRTGTWFLVSRHGNIIATGWCPMRPGE